jgi:hypothetical protein
MADVENAFKAAIGAEREIAPWVQNVHGAEY